MVLINFLTATLCLLGFDVAELSEEAPDDLEGLDASAAHVANLLSTEPTDSRFLTWILSVNASDVIRICGVLWTLFLTL